MNALVPIPAANVTVRVATSDDFAFIDSLQKVHSKQVGFLKRQAIESKIAAGQVLVAEDSSSGPSTSSRQGQRVGYVMGQDRYNKHDNVGLIHQMNVVPGARRKFVGMTLLKALFDRAAYGCVLYSCWCAQDIEANRFWEAMGFVPLAFRAGSAKKARVHIFWQKRIREGDTTTPWWYPAETRGGQIGAARIVLPIPPGMHWSDAKPMFLPGTPGESDAAKALPAPRTRKPVVKPAAPKRRVLARAGLLRFDDPPETAAAKPAEKNPREKKPKLKNDPILVAMAREFRDRWIERLNAGEAMLESQGKYDVTRVLPERPTTPLLPAA